jgi:hypothetical protein
VKLGRLRRGEWLAGLSAAGLLVVLFFDWFSLGSANGRRVVVIGSGPGGVDGWGSLGWFAVLLLLLAIFAGLAVAVLTAMPAQSAAIPVGSTVLATILGAIGVVVIVVRLIFQPGLGIGAPGAFVDVEEGAWLGLLLSLGIAAGGWLALRDERPPAGEGHQGPVETRPVPPTG